MGIYDTLIVEVAPWRGAEGHTYMEIEDSYGDHYRVTPDGRVWRETVGACIYRRGGEYDIPPVWLADYTARHEVGIDAPPGNVGLLFHFRRGRLVRVRHIYARHIVVWPRRARRRRPIEGRGEHPNTWPGFAYWPDMRRRRVVPPPRKPAKQLWRDGRWVTVEWM